MHNTVVIKQLLNQITLFYSVFVQLHCFMLIPYSKTKDKHMKTIKPIAYIKWLTLYVVVFSTLFSSLGYAGGSYHQSHHLVNWAKVTRVEPITHRVERRIPEEQCWNEQVKYYDGHRDHYRDRGNSYTSTIVGGIIGGALGNAVGHKKKNKKIGTAVGAILGASIGSEIGASGRKHHKVSTSRYRNERRCEVTYHVNYEEEILAYRVWFRYKGEEYKTRMNHKPGKKIKVRVSVEPI
ncbi:MAG: hypothetical protein ACJAWS_000163 [Oleiphilaceae bacterium]